MPPSYATAGDPRDVLSAAVCVWLQPRGCRAVLHSFVEQPSDINAVSRLLKTISKPR